MRFPLLLCLDILCASSAFAVPPTQPSVLAVRPNAPSVRIGECEIAPIPQNSVCNPQQCVASGGWCELNTVRGRCYQSVLKPDEHGAFIPARQSWAKGLKRGHQTPCAGCLCRRAFLPLKIQTSPNHSHALATGTISPVDAAMIEGEAEAGTGPHMSMAKDTMDASGKRILSDEEADTSVRKHSENEGRNAGGPGPKVPSVRRKAVLATGPRMGHAELAYMAMDGSVSREQRHERAPYAFSPRGYLYKAYFGVLDVVDDAGVRIVSEKKAVTLAGGRIQLERLRSGGQYAGDAHAGATHAGDTYGTYVGLMMMMEET
ncbi:hypothetical protein MMC30_006945 [Trapelia coarctata]|nr:hypothetical protein [Trapelia coarctata]